MKLLPISLAVLLVTAGLPGGALAADDGRPLADAGLDQSTTAGSTVYLDGGGSVDPDGELVDYQWTIRTPSGDAVDPADPEAPMTRFVPDEPGRYRVQLTVTDDDGQSHSDTLYVDVERSEEPPETTPASTPTSTPTPRDTPDRSTDTESDSTDAPAPPSSGDGAVPNRPPTGEIDGPSSVTSGSRVTYTLDTADADGTVADSWWLPTTLSADRAARSDLGGNSRTITVDGTAGTTAEIAAVVVDDDGATSTVTKSVKIVNTPPTASIEGDGTAVVNTTKEYRLRATDPDGEITSVSLETDSAAVEPTEPMPWDGPTSSGEWERSFRFTEIPKDDGTVTFEATVEDEHGGVTTVEKSVTVVRASELAGAEPVAQSPPEILSVDAYYGGESGTMSDGLVLFSATARDATSDRLTFVWEIGEQAMLETADGGDPAQGNVTYAFDDVGTTSDDKVDVAVTVRDQYGNERSESIEVDLQPTRADGGSYGRSRPVEVTNVQGRTIYGRFGASEQKLGERIVISYGDERMETLEVTDPYGTTFSHQYDSTGRYAITVSPTWTDDFSETRVDVGGIQYEIFSYERKVTTTHRTSAAESPGEAWEREGIDRIERNRTGLKTMRTLADGRGSVVSPGQEWTHVGTTTEYHTERRTDEATEAPGSDWSISERNVGQKQVFDDWRTTTIPQRDLLGGDWEYVETVSTTDFRTETKESTDRPDGSGWDRGEKLRETQVDYRTKSVDYRFQADADWEYIGSERYISHYEESTECLEYLELQNTDHCIDEETEKEPVYDRRYQYRVPEYDTVYEWERTVEETETEYRYRTATYDTEAVHEYEREVRVGTEYAEWERPIYEETEIYRWTKTTESWNETQSLTKPTDGVRNLDRTLKECSAERDPSEPPKPPKCEGGEN